MTASDHPSGRTTPGIAIVTGAGSGIGRASAQRVPADVPSEDRERAWPGVLAIPKAGRVAHVRENRKAADIVLDAQDLAELDAAFPPPAGPSPLAIL